MWHIQESEVRMRVQVKIGPIRAMQPGAMVIDRYRIVRRVLR